MMVGCFAVIFGYYGDGRGEISGPALHELGRIRGRMPSDLARRFRRSSPTCPALREFAARLKVCEGRSSTSARRIIFYRLLAYRAVF